MGWKGGEEEKVSGGGGKEEGGRVWEMRGVGGVRVGEGGMRGVRWRRVKGGGGGNGE